MFQKLKAYLAEDSLFISEGKERIATQNNHMLADGCILYAFVLAFYTTLAFVTKQPALMKTMYIAFDFIHLVLCVAVFTHAGHMKKNYAATQVFCFAFEMPILSFFALEGALFSTDQHSLYVPIAIILVLILYIHSAIYSGMMILCYTLSFAVMSFLHKTPEAFTNDLFIAIATLIGANVGYVLIARIRRNEQKALREYEKLSKTDILTGLYNKAGLDEQCHEKIDSAGNDCALIVIDLDNFKQVNDIHGHGIGDEVLKSFGSTVQAVFRSTGISGRFGGDEFLILLKPCENEETIREKVAKLREEISQLKFSIPTLQIRFCAGATMKQDGDNFHSMFSRADKALYDAKGNGKDGICIE